VNRTTVRRRRYSDDGNFRAIFFCERRREIVGIVERRTAIGRPLVQRKQVELRIGSHEFSKSGMIGACSKAASIGVSSYDTRNRAVATSRQENGKEA
jgi:hypothetical protein